MILRSRGRGQPRQGVAVVPRHPLRRSLFQLLSVPEQFGQIAEGIGVVQLAGVDQAHEEVAHARSVHLLIEERVLPVQDCLLQCPLDDIVVEWRAFLPQEQRQLRPAPEQVRDCFAQPRAYRSDRPSMAGTLLVAAENSRRFPAASTDTRDLADSETGTCIMRAKWETQLLR